MARQDGGKNFEFNIIDKWRTYDSSRDKTNLDSNNWVIGSKNVYKKLNGNIATRDGQKRRGVPNATASAVSSEFVWNTSWGATYTLLISNHNLYVVIDDVWYSLLSGLNKTRYVFDKWWDDTEKKDRVLFVNGTSNMFDWSGGYAIVNGLSGVITAINAVPSAGGLGYVPGDILTVSGGSTPATVIVTSTGLAGTITGITLTTGGSGYTTGINKPTTGGTGTGAFIEITTVASPSSTTLTKQNVAISWQQAGFSTTSGQKKIMIGGVEYTYTGGEATPTLTGVTPDPSSIPDGTVALQSVLTEPNTPAAGFSADFLKVINNQVYVGSYVSRLCYISQNTNFKNYTVPVPRAPGDPELLTLDATLKGIGVRQGNAWIGVGTDRWAQVTFTNITVGTDLTQQTKVDIKPVALNQAPYAHEFIDNVGDSLVYLAQDQQVRSVGDFNNLFTPGYPSFSQAIATELSAQNFTGGALRCIGEFVYVIAPATGTYYLYQVRYTIDEGGNVVAERLWHAPFIGNLTRIDSLNGEVIGFSNANPQIYDLWNTNQWHDDSPSGEALPYECVFARAYQGKDRRQGMWNFDKCYSEGYMTLGTPLWLNINYNWNGAENMTSQPINGNGFTAYFFTPNQGSVPSLGDKAIGYDDESLGDSEGDDSGNIDDDSYPKFRAINDLTQINVFEWQVVYWSDDVDARWEIEASGTNEQRDPEQDATFIKVKRVQ